MKTADSFYSKYEFPLRRDRSSGVYTKDDLLDFTEAFATERDQEIKDMIDAEIELYEGIIKSTEDKPTKMAFEGSVLALNKIRSKL